MRAGGHSASHSSLAERYKVLLEIGRTLTGTLSHRELYRTLLTEVSKVLPADGFYVALYDGESDEATVVLVSDGGSVSAPADPFPGSDSSVLRDGVGVLVRDGLQDHSLLVVGDPEGPITRSGICAPLRRKGRILGAVSTQSFEPHAFDEDDLELLQGICDLAAVALENAHYVAELERKTREAEQVEAIGRALTASLDPQRVMGQVVDAVVDLVDAADGAALWTIHPGMIARVAFSVGEVQLPVGSEWVLKGTELEALARAGKGVLVGDLSDYPLIPDHLKPHISGGSGLAVPLRVANEVAGVLSCGSREPNRLRARHLAILERLASQASVALENARLHASVQSLSLTDPLTGLPNRRHLKIHLQREVAAARRGRALVAVLFDLDNFKGYNDSQGHLAGDDALRAFGQILVEENRAMNLVARYGGDEFISILSESTDAGADGYVQRICDRVAEDPILAPAGITVSHGRASFLPGEMRTGEDLIQAADDDLYTAKGDRR